MGASPIIRAPNGVAKHGVAWRGMSVQYMVMHRCTMACTCAESADLNISGACASSLSFVIEAFCDPSSLKECEGCVGQKLEMEKWVRCIDYHTLITLSCAAR